MVQILIYIVHSKLYGFYESVPYNISWLIKMNCNCSQRKRNGAQSNFKLPNLKKCKYWILKQVLLSEFLLFLSSEKVGCDSNELFCSSIGTRIICPDAIPVYYNLVIEGSFEFFIKKGLLCSFRLLNHHTSGWSYLKRQPVFGFNLNNVFTKRAQGWIEQLGR